MEASGVLAVGSVLRLMGFWKHVLSSCGRWFIACGLWDLPVGLDQPEVPALEKFLTNGPPGKFGASLLHANIISLSHLRVQKQRQAGLRGYYPMISSVAGQVTTGKHLKGPLLPLQREGEIYLVTHVPS